MNEREAEPPASFDESKFLPRSIVSSFPKIFGQFRGLAWSGAALLVIFSLSLLLWLNAGNRWNQESEIAQTFDSNTDKFNPAQIASDERVFAPPPQNPSVDKPIPAPEANRLGNTKSSQPSARQKTPNSALQENISRNSTKQILADRRDNISSTRGGVLPADCGSETSVETEIGLIGEAAVTLKWKKIPKAVKYHLYVSDDEEILIDEYETERETSYTVKKSLDTAKTYNWKVVVTTEDGKTIVGDSQKFTVKSLQLNRNKSGKKQKQQIRCSQNN